MQDPLLDGATATAILGVDTLWGGDVLDPSGAGRFIADSWFSDAPLPAAYTHPAAARLRKVGGVSGSAIDAAAVDDYLAAVDVAGAVRDLGARSRTLGGLRGAYLEGVATSLAVMWDLAEERLGRGPAVPYSRCVIASCGREPEPSRPEEKRRRVAELLARAGHPSRTATELLAAVDAWRAERIVPRRSIGQLGDAFIALLEEGTRRHVVPHLPPSLHGVPRSNVRFVPLEEATFSGSMNYVGRARDASGAPLYEATYELNTSLQISVPEFAGLVAHEVVPGHATTFALAQALHVQGRLGFEATVLTMNTRGAALFEGIANNAILMAAGVTEVEELPDEDLQIGTLLFHLQDDAKNQCSWLTWGEGRPQAEVAATLRADYLVSEERAEKLSGPWGRHPLLGRMYLPSYRAGTEKVAALRREHPPGRILPALFGVHGLVDLVTIDEALR
ncbi:MAG: hypothetical protein RJA59_1111 [Pseudomonadota bacterium]|jgi:hypothetical protein